MSVSLKLPNNENKSYEIFEDYERDFNSVILNIIEQKKWIWLKERRTPEDINFREEIIHRQYKLLFIQQKKKFNSPDPLAWDQRQEELKNIGKKYFEDASKVKVFVDHILSQYESLHSNTKKRGRHNFRLAVMAAYGEELHYIKDWDNNHLHGAHEIEIVFLKLLKLNKLDIVNYFV